MSRKPEINFGWFTELRVYLSTPRNTIPPELVRAHALLNDPRMREISRLPYKGYTLAATGEHMDGITAPIAAVFYPNHTNRSTGGARTGGAPRGMTVDREITALVNYGVIPENPSEYTLRTLRFLFDLGIKPFACQVMVYDRETRLATEIDIMAIYTDLKYGNDNVVTVELKTGFPEHYEAAHGTFDSPYVPNSLLTKIPKSFRSMHELQALVQQIILGKGYGNLVYESIVMLITETKARNGNWLQRNAIYRISESLIYASDDVHTNLLHRLPSALRGGNNAQKAWRDTASRTMFK